MDKNARAPFKVLPRVRSRTETQRCRLHTTKRLVANGYVSLPQESLLEMLQRLLLKAEDLDSDAMMADSEGNEIVYKPKQVALASIWRIRYYEVTKALRIRCPFWRSLICYEGKSMLAAILCRHKR